MNYIGTFYTRHRLWLGTSIGLMVFFRVAMALAGPRECIDPGIGSQLEASIWVLVAGFMAVASSLGFLLSIHARKNPLNVSHVLTGLLAWALVMLAWYPILCTAFPPDCPYS